MIYQSSSRMASSAARSMVSRSSSIKKASVVQIRSTNVSHTAIGKEVIAALIQMADELADGALVTVEPQRTRLRLLPFWR